jgi:dTDP-4-dehydrorhamnose reductase
MSSSRPVVILGATGQLGSDIVRAAAAAGIDHVALGHQDVEVTDSKSLESALTKARPSVVINSAAFHQVDRCEEDPAEAYRVNSVASLLTARAARAADARYVYVSTDYVFDGARDPRSMYAEDDAINPLNVYGASKAAGEQLARQALAAHLVVRVSSLFGVAGARGKGGNFIETILKKAREGGPLKVVSDQWMTPTYTADAAEAILRLATSEVTGIVHVTNPESCTWHAFASEAVSAVGLGVPVEAVTADTFPSKVRRPRNSAMATERLKKVLGSPLRPWHAALRSYLQAKGHLN